MVDSRLVEFARDLSGGDEAVVGRVDAALRHPPMTTETVGFYGASGFTPAENCFLFTVTQLSEAGMLLSAEDKYSHGLIDTFAEVVSLPQAMRSWFPKRLRWDGDFEALGLTKKTHGRAEARAAATWREATRSLEASFEATGRPLRLLQFWRGDTMPFIRVTPAIAARWEGVAFAHDAWDRPLGLARPDWPRLMAHFSYAVGWTFPIHEDPASPGPAEVS